MEDEENRYPSRPMTESEALADQQRQESAIKKLYPRKFYREDGRLDHDETIEYVSRLRGPEPDAYNIIAAGAWFELNRVLHEKAELALWEVEQRRMRRLQAAAGTEAAPEAVRKPPGDGGIMFRWEHVVDHPILKAVEDLSVSMGGGKGRKEGVELGKTNPPMQPRSRWSLRRER